MKTLEDLFSRYGRPNDQMDERINLYYTRASKIENITEVVATDKRVQQEISRLIEITEQLKEYRKTLAERAKEFYKADYTMQLKIERRVDSYNNKKFYIISILKVLDLSNARPQTILNETFTGKERSKALKRLEELQKQYPNIETIKDIDKKSWER